MAIALATPACSSSDDAPALAAVSFSSSKARAPLGSPIDMTYQFDVAAGAAFPKNYRVFVHVIHPDGTLMWSDDHDPPTPTSTWGSGQTVRYTRTRFIPVYPYLGEARVRMGLYDPADMTARAPLNGPDPRDRSYLVGTLNLLPQSDNVYVRPRAGWHAKEFSASNPSMEWQWSQKEGILHFANPKRGATLYLEYDARADVFPTPQTVTVFAGAEQIFQFTADNTTPLLRRIPITAAQLGTADTAEVRIVVDRTLIPAKLASGQESDNRELGIRVYHAFIEAP